MGRLKERLKDVDWHRAIMLSVVGLIALLALGYAGVSIYCFAAYGGKPAGDIPAWALWFMFGFGR